MCRVRAESGKNGLRIAVIGAGVIGVTTAWELAQDGHAVTVFDRRQSAAEESSFANAGVIAPGYVTPWAAPGMPWKVLTYLLKRHAPVRVGLPLTAQELAWMWRWWRACRLDTYLANRSRMMRLAMYSRERLHKLTSQLGLEYDRSEGYTVLLRGPRDARLVQPGLQVLRDAGIAFREIDAVEARRLEPALNPDTELHGAIHLPQDEAANCRQFVLMLKDAARHAGVEFRFGEAVTAIASEPGARASLIMAADAQAQAYDAIVVCAGVASASLLRPLGIHLPLVPVHGYSVSTPLREALHAPRGALMDERYKVAIVRLGQRVRVAGSAQLGGRERISRDGPLQTLYRVLRDWFPGAATLSHGVQEWKGARPMLPDGPPVIGASPRPGIWLNLGHGSSGWALSCGSARLIADQIAGRTPEISLEGLGIERLLN